MAAEEEELFVCLFVVLFCFSKLCVCIKLGCTILEKKLRITILSQFI